MGNKFSRYRLSNESGKVRRNNFHSILKILLHLFTVVDHVGCFITEFEKRLDIEVTDFLAHRVGASFDNFFCYFSILHNFFDFFGRSRGGLSILN